MILRSMDSGGGAPSPTFNEHDPRKGNNLFIVVCSIQFHSHIALVSGKDHEHLVIFQGLKGPPLRNRFSLGFWEPFRI
jgi:hypothetical protein